MFFGTLETALILANYCSAVPTRLSDRKGAQDGFTFQFDFSAWKRHFGRGGDWTRVYFRTTIKCPAPWH